MDFIVLATGQKLEIFDPIVGFIMVLMMNNLSLFKFASQKFFHFKAMLKSIYAGDFIEDENISTLKTPTTRPRWRFFSMTREGIAFMGAKFS